MTNQKNRPKDAADLRQKAEALARERVDRISQDSAALSPEDTRKTLHELRVHQIELELQNVELRQAQAEIEAGRARYYDLYKLAPVGYLTLSEQGLILEANLTAATLLETNRGLLVKQPISRFILKDDQDIYYLHHKKLFETHSTGSGQACEPQECELRLLKPDGALFWAHLTATAAQAEDGAPVCRGVISDITERKRAEETLRESEETHRALIEGLPDTVMRFDREGRHLFVSDNVCEMVDMEAAQFIGKTHAELGFPEAQCRFWEESIRRVFDSGGPFETEFTIEGLRQAVLWPTVFNWRLVPERDEQGAVSSVLSISRDITAYRKAELEYRTLFSKMLDGFALHEIICNESGKPVDYRFLAVNPAFERMTGLKAEAIVGRTVLEVLPDTEIHWIETYGQVALTQEPVVFNNFSAALQKHFVVTAFSLVSGQFACIFADITERKRVEEEREKLQSELLQAQKMESVGILAGGIAHDFNNLLHAMGGNLELLDRKLAEDHPGKKRIPTIQKSINRAAQLVRQMLLFSRKAEAQRQDMDLNQEIQEAGLILERTIPKMISIELDLDKEARFINADPIQVEQVLLNLGSNAADAMPDGGRLIIETSNVDVDEALANEHTVLKKGGYVLLRVSDTGCGMDEETLDKVFDPFFTTKEVGKGTGLGLASAYGIVKAHDGYITCESKPDKGTTFKIYWPAVNTKLGDD